MDQPTADPVEESYVVPHPETGEEIKLNKQQMQDLATFGFQAFLESEKEKETTKEEETKELTADEKLAALEAKIANMEKEKESAKESERMNSQINTALDKYEITRDRDSRVSKKVRLVALASLAINPKVNLDEVIANEVKDFMELVKEGKTGNMKMAHQLSGLTRGGSGVPAVDKGKTFTADDLKSGAVRKAFREFLESKE